jgi:hypothetical protein
MRKWLVDGSSGRLALVLCILTFAWIGLLVFIVNPKLDAALGQLASFDGRRCGYDPTTANLILAGFAKNGADAYLNWHFPLDMIFPFIYGPAVAVTWLFLAARLGLQSVSARALALAPIIAAGLDLSENLLIRSLVVAGPPADGGMVQIASMLTQGKYYALTIGVVPTLALLAIYAERRLAAARSAS